MPASFISASITVVRSSFVRATNLIVGITGLCCAIRGPSTSAEPAGSWSKKGLLLERPGFPAFSPNHRSAILFTNAGVVLRHGGKRTALPDIVSTPSLIEVIWSPRSDKFLINSSDGGAVGEWDSFLYERQGDRLSKPIKLRSLLGAFETSRHECKNREPYNVASIGWINDDEILVVKEVPPHSSCIRMAQQRGYFVSLRGRPFVSAPIQNAEFVRLLRLYGSN